MPKKADDLLTVTMAAKLLGVTRQGISVAIQRGALKSRKVGTIQLISRADLDAYRKSRKPTGRPPSKNK